MSEEMSGGESMESGDFEGEEREEIEQDDEGEREPPPKPKKPAPKMRKIKVGGREEYVDEDKVFRDYQKYRGGDQRLREAAQKEQENQKMRAQLEEDPEEFFRNNPNLSAKKKELAHKWMLEDLEEKFVEVDPRDKRLSEQERRIKEFEDRDKEKAENEKLTEKQKFVETRKTALSETLHEAMQASHLSAHPESAAATLREMVVYLRAAKEQGEEVDVNDLVQHLHSSRFHQMYTLAHQYQGEELCEFLGDVIVDRIMKAKLQKLRSGRGQGMQTHRNEKKESPSSKRKFINPSDVRWQIRNGE